MVVHALILIILIRQFIIIISLLFRSLWIYLSLVDQIYLSIIISIINLIGFWIIKILLLILTNILELLILLENTINLRNHHCWCNLCGFNWNARQIHLRNWYCVIRFANILLKNLLWHLYIIWLHKLIPLCFLIYLRRITLVLNQVLIINHIFFWGLLGLLLFQNGLNFQNFLLITRLLVTQWVILGYNLSDAVFYLFELISFIFWLQ